MPEHLTAADAAGRLRTTDSFGMPLATGQPAAFIEALGARDDWQDLRVYGALLVVLSNVFNHPNEMVTMNAALAIDIHGQVVADTIAGAQYSGIGGHEDFMAGARELENRSLLCLPSTVTRGAVVISRLVPYFPAGTVITTPRHHVDVVITEYGFAELRGRTVQQRGEALAAIAHPDFRDELLEAAVRAARGHAVVPIA